MKEKIDVKNRTVKLGYDKEGNLEEIILEEKYDVLDVLDNDDDCGDSIKKRLIEHGLCVEDVEYWDCAEILLIIGTCSNKVEKILQIEEEGVWGIGAWDINRASSPSNYTLLNVAMLKSKREE